MCWDLWQGNMACSVQWGAWAGAGMAAGTPELATRQKRSGLDLVTPRLGLRALGDFSPVYNYSTL